MMSSKMLRHCFFACTCLLMAAGALTTLSAADPPKAPTVKSILDGQLKSAESEIVSLAEAMPVDKYQFAPTAGEFKGARTFAQQVKHIAATNYSVAASMLGEKSPAAGGENGPDDMTNKEAIVKFLKDSFAYTHKAMATMTNDNVTEMIASPFGPGKMPRLSAANITAWHSFDHYGQMAIYARMNNVIPPASKQ